MQPKRSPSGMIPQPSPPAAAPRIASRDLLGPAGTLVIVHQGREYLLRVTQNGRLILTA